MQRITPYDSCVRKGGSIRESKIFRRGSDGRCDHTAVEVAEVAEGVKNKEKMEKSSQIPSRNRQRLGLEITRQNS
jgi:hypothetical protein